MNRSKSIILALLVLPFLFSACKDDDPIPYHQTLTLKIDHEWNDSALVLNKNYFWQHHSKVDTIKPTTLIYHINNLVLTTQDSLTIGAESRYYMVDYGERKVYPSDISFKTPKAGVNYYVTSLDFTIGVEDSLTNSKGELNSYFVAPMYWGMIQGYINFKFEAASPQATANAIIYHIGGYTMPYKNYRKIKLNFDKPYLLNKENTLTISANLYKLFDSKHMLDISTNNLVHSPNDNSVLVADNMATMFSFKNMK